MFVSAWRNQINLVARGGFVKLASQPTLIAQLRRDVIVPQRYAVIWIAEDLLHGLEQAGGHVDDSEAPTGRRFEGKPKGGAPHSAARNLIHQKATMIMASRSHRDRRPR